MKKLNNGLIQPFLSGKKINIGLALVFLLINSIVFINAYFHDPNIGYDAYAHLRYIQTLSELRLVTPYDSYEFFSPPLPYLFPALLIYLIGIPVMWAAKVAQFFNFFLSVGLTWYLIKICKLISPRSSLRFGTLVFLGILPVYYKTFAFVRGEPYIIFFAVVILYYTLLMSIREQFTVTNAIILGGAMGLCALSRQWGILLLAPIFLFLFFQWIRLPHCRHSIIKSICLCLVVLFLVSGWFYISLQERFGSITAFNKKPEAQLSFRNQPLDFYFGLDYKLLFRNPLRPSFPNQFLPIFYSDLWGDYWGYFVFYSKDTRRSTFVNSHRVNKPFSKDAIPYWLETNYKTIGPYLGRVNFVSIFASALALVSLVFAVVGMLRRRISDPLVTCQRELYFLLLCLIGASMAGYFWYLIMYPSIGKGGTMKATYMLQIFPFIAILVGIFLEYIKMRSQFFYHLMLGGLYFTFVHNFFAIVTRY